MEKIHPYVVIVCFFKISCSMLTEFVNLNVIDVMYACRLNVRLLIINTCTILIIVFNTTNRIQKKESVIDYET